jgi:hypothetical protein
MLKSHTLVPERTSPRSSTSCGRRERLRGRAVDGLYNAWIILNNPEQLNSYTTEAVKEVILAFRQASMDRRVVACVFTGVGDRPSAPAAIRRSTPSTTPAIRRNTSSTCGCSTT